MNKIIAVANQKGGVGKTTSSINLAASLAAAKRRVLLIDMDPQGNATVGSGITKAQLKYTSHHVLTDEVEIEQAILLTPGKFALLPSNNELIVAEVKLMQAAKRESRLHEVLAKIAKNYEYILIDCPPALNILTVNALVAADSVLIPIQCEYFALEGLSSLLQTIEQIQTTLNPRLHIEGLLRTMYDGRNRLATEVSGQLLQHFPNQVYHTVVPRNVRLAEAPSHGMPILLYDEKSQGSLAYLALAGEILRRHESKSAQKSTQEVTL